MFEIRSSRDVSQVRLAVREAGKRAGLGLVELTKFVTATSELARNMWVHAGGGVVTWSEIREKKRHGFSAVFQDEGPGIEDIDLAFTDGYTTSSGLGLGFAGSRRLVSEFRVISEKDQGTRVEIIRWTRA